MATLKPILAWCLLFTAGISKGQEKTAADSLSTYLKKSELNKLQQLQGVEVSAIRAGSDAPFAKTNINGQYLQKANLGQDLPFLLQYTPSLVTTSDAGAGVGYTGIRIRGTNASRINVTMNGIPVNDPDEQSAFFVDIPDIASSTNSIQIQRGVGTSTNGSGAFGATISLSTLKQMDSAGAVFNSSTGSFNTFKNTLIAGTGMLAGGFQFDVRLSKISSDGYVNRGTSDLKSLQFTAGWKASEKTWFHFMLLTGTEKTGQAWDGVNKDSLNSNRRYNDLGLKPDGTYYKNQTDNYQQDYYQLFADHSFSRYITGHAGLFLTRGKGYYEVYSPGQSLSSYIPNGDSVKPSDLITQLWLDNYYYGGVFSLMYQKRKTQITFGGGATGFDNKHYGIVTWSQNGGVPDNYKWYNRPDYKTDLNFYLKAQQMLGDKWVLFADVQYRNIDWKIDGFKDHPDIMLKLNYGFFNPKAGISYLLHNTSQHYEKLYASVAVAHREAQYADYETSPANYPNPETLYDFEGGYEVIKRKWSAGANVYYMSYDNQLVLTGKINDVGSYTQTNVPQSYRAGLELQGAVKPLYWLAVNANTTFSRSRILNFNEYIDNENGGQDLVKHQETSIGFSPDIIASGAIAITPFRKLRKSQTVEFDLLGKYVDKQYLDNSSDNNRSLAAYQVYNALVRYSVKFGPFKEAVVSFQVNNILNTKYVNNGYVYYVYNNDKGMPQTDNRYFPQAGTNFLAGITLRW